MNQLFPPQFYGNQTINPLPIQIPQPQPVPLPNIVSGPQLIRVNGLESAKMYPCQPNSTVALFDENEDIMYIKSTDASNFPTIRKFVFHEVTEEAASEEKYVTLEEFEALKKEIEDGQQFIREFRESLQKPVAKDLRNWVYVSSTADQNAYEHNSGFPESTADVKYDGVAKSAIVQRYEPGSKS